MQECVLCKEYITNPLCPSCIADQVVSWLMEVKPELIDELRIETNKMNLDLFKKNRCIKCKGFMDVCTYCYTNHIFDWLKEKKVSGVLLNEFLDFFHFDLEKKGYLKPFVQ